MSQQLRLACLAHLADIPKWVEVRDLLINPESRIISFNAPHSFAVWHESDAIGAFVGVPDANIPTDVLQSIQGCDELLAFADNRSNVATILPNFIAERANIYRQCRPASSPSKPTKRLSLREIEWLAEHHNDLFAELQWALFQDVPVWAALCDAQPVSFAYAASQSETLWNMSVDTLDAYRQQGYAKAVTLALMSEMQAQGKTAVWGALDSNNASNQLALSLGFELVDELWVLSAKRESNG